MALPNPDIENLLEEECQQLVDIYFNDDQDTDSMNQGDESVDEYDDWDPLDIDLNEV